MRKSSVYLLVVLTLVSLGLTLVPMAFCQTSQAQDLKVTNWSYYFTNGNLNVVGEIQNTGTSTVTSVFLTGSVIDVNGVDQADSTSQALVQYLLPQQESPFYMSFTGGPNSAPDGTWGTVKISYVNFTVSSSTTTTNYQYPDLKITQESSSVPTSGTYQGAFLVNYTIKNTGAQTAQNIWVIGAFYNSTGTIVGVGYTEYLTPSSLAPSQTLSSSIAALDLDQTQVPTALQISSYTLTVQSADPVLQGTPPPTTTNTPVTAQKTANSNGSPASNKTSIYVVVIVVVILVVAVGTVLALRKRKPVEPVAEVKEAKNAGKKPS